MESASTPQLIKILDLYNKVLPSYTFPFIPFVIAAVFQSFAWVAGPTFFKNYTLLPRMLLLLLFAAGEYLFMSPAMNAGVEIYNMKESHLVIEYHITTLIVFILINILVFKKSLEIKYVFSFIFCGLAIYLANIT